MPKLSRRARREERSKEGVGKSSNAAVLLVLLPVLGVIIYSSVLETIVTSIDPHAVRTVDVTFAIYGRSLQVGVLSDCCML